MLLAYRADVELSVSCIAVADDGFMFVVVCSLSTGISLHCSAGNVGTLCLS